MDFKGTKEEWLFRPPTQKFDACTVSFSGKIIGYAARNTKEDRANEKLRAAAPELLKALQTWEVANALGDAQLLAEARTLRTMALEKALK